MEANSGLHSHQEQARHPECYCSPELSILCHRCILRFSHGFQGHASVTSTTDIPALKRTLNLPLVAFYGTGTILGAGIYALIGKVAGAAGLLAPLAFLVSAILASFTAYAYCQLVARYPKSGGEAEYVYRGFNARWLSNLVG